MTFCWYWNWWCWRDLRLCQLIILPCHRISIYFMGSEVAWAGLIRYLSTFYLHVCILWPHCAHFADLWIMRWYCLFLRRWAGSIMAEDGCIKTINTLRWPLCQIDWDVRGEGSQICRDRGDKLGFDGNDLLESFTDFKLKVSPPCQGKDEVPAAAVRCQNVIYLFSAFCAAFWDTATILRQGSNHNINLRQPKIFRINSSVKCALAWNWFVIDTNEK